ncbi:tetratricopeptide repeat protein [Mucilaginibacter sp.]
MEAYQKARLIHQKLYFEELDDLKKNILYTEYFLQIRKAAYANHLEALFDMGQQYEDMGYLGRPNPNYNPKKCIYWYTKACNNGHAEACNNLATFYENGEGCEKDLSFALQLYQKAADRGSASGKKNYKVMKHDLAIGGKYNIKFD